MTLNTEGLGIRLSLWADDKICLADWNAECGLEVSFETALWKEYGGLHIGAAPPIFINKWIELRVDGSPAWRREVPEKVLKERERIRAEEEAQRQSRPDDVT